MSDRPLWQFGAVELAQEIRNGNVRASDVVASALERMEQCNPQVNAVTMSLSDTAMAQEADRLQKSGAVTGALHGVPITIKENIDQQGIENTNGLPALADNNYPV